MVFFFYRCCRWGVFFWVFLLCVGVVSWVGCGSVVAGGWVGWCVDLGLILWAYVLDRLGFCWGVGRCVWWAVFLSAEFLRLCLDSWLFLVGGWWLRCLWLFGSSWRCWCSMVAGF